MLVIRLARGGRNKYPVYRIVAAEQSRAVTGKFVAILGHYNPHTKDLVIQKEETMRLIGNGAQPSNSVVRLLQKEKMELPKWVELKTKDRKPKKEPVEKPEAAAPADEPTEEEVASEEAAPEAPVEETTEAPTEEKAEEPTEEPAEEAKTDEAPAE